MKIGDRNMPGPGDEETWPACTNHPLDPRTPEPLPDDECDVEELCERYGASDLAVMLQAAFAESNLLRARLRKAEADAARWQEVSRHGPRPMQILDPRLGVITRNGADADRHVDQAIAERKALDVREVELRG